VILDSGSFKSRQCKPRSGTLWQHFSGDGSTGIRQTIWLIEVGLSVIPSDKCRPSRQMVCEVACPGSGLARDTGACRVALYNYDKFGRNCHVKSRITPYHS